MSTYTEGALPLEFLLSEGNGDISREQVTIVSGTPALKAGRVLGKVTASGKYAAYDNTLANGTEVAAAILTHDVDASAADTLADTIFRLATVKAAALGWGGNDGTGVTAGLADLAASGKLIIART